MSAISSNFWMGGLNLVFPLPVKYLSFYTDLGLTDRVWNDFAEERVETPLLYDYGLQLNLIKDYLEVYFPIGYSQAIKNDYELAGLGDDPTTVEKEVKYLRKIKFMFNMNKLYQVLQ